MILNDFRWIEKLQLSFKQRTLVLWLLLHRVKLFLAFKFLVREIYLCCQNLHFWASAEIILLNVSTYCKGIVINCITMSVAYNPKILYFQFSAYTMTFSIYKIFSMTFSIYKINLNHQWNIFFYKVTLNRRRNFDY